MNQQKKLTHGEAWYKAFVDVIMVDGEFKPRDETIMRDWRLPPKMKRKDALKYYSNKIRDYFDSKSDMRSLGFYSAEEYFDYFETKKIAQRVLS
jgi:hypothetical protein